MKNRHSSEVPQFFQSFLAGTTQEIVYPLKNALNLTEYILKKYSDCHFEYIGHKEFKEMLQTLETMRDELKYCFETTQRLLKLDKKRVGMDIEGSDANEIIRRVIGMLKYQFDIFDISMQLNLAKKLPVLKIGALELAEVIVNILNNSIQSIMGGGKVYFRTRYLSQKRSIEIECRDEGIGIPKDVLPHVFEPFFTTKKETGQRSPGLGLSIAQAMIKASKGEISIKSSLQKGTTVTILLPVQSKP